MPEVDLGLETVAPRHADKQLKTISKPFAVNAEYVVADQCRIPETVLFEGKINVLIAGVVEPEVHVVLSANGAVGPLLQTMSDLSSSFVGTRQVVLPPKLLPLRLLQLVYAELAPVPFNRSVEELLQDWLSALQY